MDFLAMGKCQRGEYCQYQHIAVEQYAKKREEKVATATSKVAAMAAAASAQVRVLFSSIELLKVVTQKPRFPARSVLGWGDSRLHHYNESTQGLIESYACTLEHARCAGI